MIYLILCAGFKDNNPDQFEKRLKIGYTDNLENRLKAYLTTNPDFILLQTRDGGLEIESYLHKKFEKYRYKDSREWFYYNQEIVDNFQSNLEDCIDEDILLDFIKKDIRSKISSVEELKEKYLNQILDEIKSLSNFSEELYDEDVIISRIIEVWKEGFKCINCSIEKAKIINFQPTNLFSTDISETTGDIILDLPYIPDRQKLLKNPWKSKIDLYYKSTKTKKESIEKLRDKIDSKKTRTENLLLSYNSTPTVEAKHDLSVVYKDRAAMCNYKNDYVSVNIKSGKDLYPVFNNLVMVSELRAFEIQQIDYKDRFVVINQLKSKSNTVISVDRTDQFLEDFNNLTLFTDKMKALYDISFIFSEDEMDYVLGLIHMSYRNYFTVLGRDRIKSLSYQRSKLSLEYEKLKSAQTGEYDLQSMIYSGFKEGNRYTMYYIKQVLSDLYKELGLLITPKATDLENYFEVKNIQIINKETGKKDRGYLILKKKE